MSSLAETIRELAILLMGTSSDYDAVQESVGDARIVLLGEATPGTHEILSWENTRRS